VNVTAGPARAETVDGGHVLFGSGLKDAGELVAPGVAAIGEVAFRAPDIGGPAAW